MGGKSRGPAAPPPPPPPPTPPTQVTAARAVTARSGSGTGKQTPANVRNIGGAKGLATAETTARALKSLTGL